MADAKISALAALTAAGIAANDVYPIVDTSATQTKKMAASEMLQAIAAVAGTNPTLITPNTDLGGGIFGGTLLSFAPPAADTTSVPFTIKALSAPFSGVFDFCLKIGTEGNGGIYDQWEQRYDQTVNAKIRERHLIYTVDTTAGGRTVGDQVRLYSYTYSSPTNYCDYYLTCNQFSIKDLSSPDLAGSPLLFLSANGQGSFAVQCTDGSIPIQGFAVTSNSAGVITIGTSGAATQLNLSQSTRVRVASPRLLVGPVVPDDTAGDLQLYLAKTSGTTSDMRGMSIESNGGRTFFGDFGVYGAYLTNGRSPDGTLMGLGGSNPEAVVTLNIGGTGWGGDLFRLSNYPSGSAVIRLKVLSGGGLNITNRTAVPGTPTGGGTLYIESGALKFIGSSGTITTVAPA